MPTSQRQEHTIRLGHDHGGVLEHINDTRLVIGHSELRALDVSHAPKLSRLRIQSAANKPFHLTLEATPRLSDISLPDNGLGGSVHWHCAQTLGWLRIDGSLSLLNIASPRGAIWAEHGSPDGCWNSAIVCSLNEVGTIDALPDLTVVLGEHSDRSDTLTLSGRGDWHLQDCHKLKFLRIETPGRVVIRHAEALHSIHCSNEATTLVLEATPNLQRLTGQVAEVSLSRRKTSATSLVVAAACPSLTLRDANLQRLVCRHPGKLSLHHCHRLQEAEVPRQSEIACTGAAPPPLARRVRLAMDEATMHEHLANVREGRLEHVDVMLRAVAAQRRPGRVLHSLITLEALCQTPVASQKIWQARRELLARQLGRSVGKRRVLPDNLLNEADIRWEWRLPCDQLMKGLAADVAIWHHCARTDPEARAYRATLLDCLDLDKLEALFRAFSQSAEESDQTLLAEAASVLSRRYRHTLPKRNILRHARHLEWGHLMARQLQRCICPPPWRSALIELMTSVLPLDITFKLLRQLKTRYPGIVRSQLLRIAQASDKWIEYRLRAHPSMIDRRYGVIRMEATGLAFAPTHSTQTTETVCQ